MGLWGDEIKDYKPDWSYDYPIIYNIYDWIRAYVLGLYDCWKFRNYKKGEK